MSARKSVLVGVRADDKYYSNERVVSRFIKMCKKERIREEVRDREGFKSKSDKRREKIARSARRRAKEARKAEEKAKNNLFSR